MPAAPHMQDITRHRTKGATDMAVFNVSVTTVMLVEANTEDDARLGAENYLQGVTGVDVVRDVTESFESEPLEHGADLEVLYPSLFASPARRDRGAERRPSIDDVTELTTPRSTSSGPEQAR